MAFGHWATLSKKFSLASYSQTKPALQTGGHNINPATDANALRCTQPMNSMYIKFADPDTQLKPRKKSWLKRAIQTLLISFIPSGNPNFEEEIDKVKQWLIEFKDGNQYPNREIGLDNLEQPIMIMPWRRNYGYWIDNNMLLKDFNSLFNPVEISKEEFEKHWDQFEQQNENS